MHSILNIACLLSSFSWIIPITGGIWRAVLWNHTTATVCLKNIRSSNFFLLFFCVPTYNPWYFCFNILIADSQAIQICQTDRYRGWLLSTAIWVCDLFPVCSFEFLLVISDFPQWSKDATFSLQHKQSASTSFVKIKRIKCLIFY